MRSLVLGGAGFVGSHLVDRLVEAGPVTVYDNLTTGKREYLGPHIEAKRVALIEGDTIDAASLTRAMNEHDVVFHLVAAPEGHSILDATKGQLDQGPIATYNVLEAMRRCRVNQLVFASSASVYGDSGEPCGELDLGHLPVSLEGASKLGSESLIAAYAECFGMRAWIFRLGTVVGPRGRHVLAVQWLERLKRANGIRLEITGDGQRAKPYLYVADCVEGMLFGHRHAASSAEPFTPSGTLREVNQIARAAGEARSRVHVFNVTPPDATTERRIAELCVAASPFRKAEISCTGVEVPKAGDVAQTRLKPDKLAALGYRVSHTSEQAIQIAVQAASREVFV